MPDIGASIPRRGQTTVRALCLPSPGGDQVKCSKCGDRRDLREWIDIHAAISLAMSHQWTSLRCELCCLKEQLEYAQRLSKTIPELEEKILQLEL